MAPSSMMRLILVLPVPITELSHTVATDIIKSATDTTLTTGTAAVIKSLF